MTQERQSPVAHTRHGDLTLDQIGDMQPGLGMIMPQVSDRYWILYYAAHGGNWQLEGLLKLAATTRPTMAKYLNAFIVGHLSAIRLAIEQQDFKAFQTAYGRGIDGANRYHVETGHSEIHWQLPPDPPRHLSLKPPDKGSP